MRPRITVTYYSSTGTVHALACALAEGAESAGAEVRLRRVPELAPAEAVRSNPAWAAHAAATDAVPVAELDDLAWADGLAFGTPTRFGNVAAQLKQFLDQTGPLWAQGALADKPVTSFTSALNAHGGHESTILALNNSFYHWGSVIVAPGYTDATVDASGGNPYGASWATGPDSAPPAVTALATARYQGVRLTRFAALLAHEPV